METFVFFGAAASRNESGNKPQTATAGNNVYQINYYGTEYSQANANPMLQMDPDKFTKPIVDVLNGPALKSPNVEECGYSDRIAQLTAGNSTITTQEAASAVVAYGVWPKPDSGAGEAIDKLSEPGPEVDRFYTLDSYLWAQGNPSFYYKLPQCLTQLGMFGQNCMYHFLFRGGFCVHVQCNASQFHQGLLLVAAIPECEFAMTVPSDGKGTLPEDFFLQYPKEQLTLFPHQLINLRTNNSATLILPYVNNFPGECPLIHDNWTVVVVPMTPLQYNTGASTTVPITVSIAPMYASFAGLRNLVRRQGGVPVHMVPGSGQFMTTLRQSGYPIYPDFQETHGWEIPGEVTNLLEVARVDTFATLNPAETNPTMYVNVSQGYNVQPIFVMDMDLNATALSSTYIARLSKWFVNWRGSLRMTFTFCGSQMATGKFLVAYTPPGGNAPTSRTDAMLGTHVIWDVGLQSSISFIVPWIAQTQYRYTGVNQNVLSYAGYVTMWYQTAVVVPPGAPSTCQIVCMVSAADDLVFRMPTDSAYYQGIGDCVEGVVENVIAQIPMTLDLPAVPGAGMPNRPAIATGDSAALTATETGATAGTQPTAMMETREVPITFSARESSVENFFTKYAVMSIQTLTSSTNILHVPLVFNDAATTQRSIVAKYRMFTYIRCHYDVVIVTSLPPGGPTNVTKEQLGIKFQIIYCPPGTAAPTSGTSALWDCPTTPSVYGSTTDPPISLRIPFVSPANAYNVFYDGYATFNNAQYGDPPANNIGQLAFRTLDGWSNNTFAGIKIRVFARPVNVRAWCPRPLVTLKSTTTASAASTRRLYYVDDDETENVRQVDTYQPFGNEDTPMEIEPPKFELKDRFEVKVMDLGGGACFRNNTLHVALDSAPKWVIEQNMQCPWFNCDRDPIPYQGIPVTHNAVIINYHLWQKGRPRMLYAGDQGLPGDAIDPTNLKYLKAIEYPERDIVVLIYPDHTFHPLRIDDSRTPTGAWVANESQFGTATPVGPCFAVQEIHVGEKKGVAARRLGIIRTEATTGHGWCGSPLLTPNGVSGMVIAGDAFHTMFVSFSCCDFLWQMETETSTPIDKFLIKKKHRAGKKHRRARYQPYGPLNAIKAYVTDVAADFGRAMGLQVSTSVINTVAEMVPDTTDLSHRLAKKVIQALVKIVCGMVLISQAEDKLSTAATVGIMIGVDIITMSPFEWLERKVLDAVGVARHQVRAYFQGPIDWVKDFNAFCTACRGLDWLGEKISKFVDWLKQLFKQESPRRRQFMAQLESLPQLMESIDEALAHRNKYNDEVILALCQNMKALKLGADIYGVERNFCTTQIVKYYAKAETLLKTVNKGRVEPVAICIHGGPGEGKSLATNIIATMLCKRAGTGNAYSLPPDPKYFDGYCQQTAVIMDDVAQNPDGEDLKLFCQMVSSAPFQVPMASLEDKGMAFTSDYVLASTNANFLTPPTVAEPKALQRRFYLDLDIVLKKEHQVKGKLNAASALKPCEGPSECHCFKVCTPMCCGKAVMFRDRNTRQEYSLDHVVLAMEAELHRRKNCGNLLDAIFQGPVLPTPKPRLPRGVKCVADGEIHPVPKYDCSFKVEQWEEIQFDVEACDIKKERTKKTPTLKCPECVVDLLRAVPRPEVIKYCEDQGWIIPPKVEIERTRSEVSFWLAVLADGLAILSSLAALGGTIYMIYSMVSRFQGAYNGESQKPKPKPPVVRRAVPQGPQMDFGTKLFNTSLVDVETDEGHFSCLGLYGKWVLVPRHADPREKIKLEGEEYSIIDQVELVKGGNTLELLAVKIDRPVDFRDLRKYFVDSHHTVRGCKLLVNNAYYPRMFCPVDVVSPNGQLHLSNTLVNNTCRYPYPTKTGQCGGVVITPDNKIIAMHIGGDGLNGFGAYIYKKYFDGLDQAKPQGEMKNERPAPISINVNRKTKLRPSVFHDVFEGTKQPAALSIFDKRLEVELDAAMFGKYKGNCPIKEPTENMKVAVEHYVSQLKPIMPRNLTDPLELEEVVYGIEGLDGLDLNTSAGYPYNTLGIRKRDIIPERGQPLTKLQEALDLHGFNLPFSTYLKDELRPLAKVSQGKTRLIECSSLNDTIRMKQVLGRLFQAFHQNPGTITGSAVGCDPDVHWSKFYAEMGDQPLLAFDYSNYDASLSPIWFECLKMVLKKLGFVADELVDHICNSTHIYANKMYDVEGGMPSGCSGTSIFNSIINNLIIRTLVLDVYKGIELDFLKIIAYGDDVIASYPFPLDAALLAEAGKSYGLTMTPADKSTCFNEVTWDTITFLKRRFVPDEKFPFLIHPVFPMEEIAESIRWCRSPAYTQQHVASLCCLAWHNGEEVYQEFVKKVRSVSIGPALFIPAYAVLRSEWLSKF
uniref:Genome polyprotein n=1 Tax=Niviventer confucianus picornavirus TaxID=2184396 RepID=A0A2S1YF53_9VIRU|nr:polyprotein [Niviventer confucianus picornavirus]